MQVDLTFLGNLDRDAMANLHEKFNYKQLQVYIIYISGIYCLRTQVLLIYNRLEPEFRDDLVTPDPLNTEESNTIIQLIITGRAEYNGTRVQCVIPGSQESGECYNDC